jgi:hypothetical protein
MTTTVHLFVIATAFFQNRRDLRYVHVFTIVAGTHQRQFMRAKAKMFGATTLHQGQGLQGFQS